MLKGNEAKKKNYNLCLMTPITCFNYVIALKHYKHEYIYNKFQYLKKTFVFL